MKQHPVSHRVCALSILFMTFHLGDDIVRGMEPGTRAPRPCALCKSLP